MNLTETETKEARPAVQRRAGPLTQRQYIMNCSDSIDPVQRMLDRLNKVKETGEDKWQACCPAHDDKNPSLSIARGDDGRVLLTCHAGCRAEDIVGAVGLTMADLFKPEPGRQAKPRKRSQQPEQMSQIEATYDYVDEHGQLIFQVVRKKLKRFVQRKPNGNEWIWDAKDVPKILYRLPEVAGADLSDWVFICEGEKDVDALRTLGLTATCNPGGAGKWGKLSSDSALEGRKVAILPDNDAPGRKHAADVAKRLHGRASEVRIVELPGLPAKGDVSDWLDERDGQEAHDLGASLLALVEEASPVTAENVETLEDWPQPEPLPTELPAVDPFREDLLPESLRPWLSDIAERMQCPLDFPAVGAMVALAGLVGRQLTIMPKQQDDWQVVPNLWGMIIGRPSIMKSPPLKEAIRPLHRLVEKANQEHDEAMMEFARRSIEVEVRKKELERLLKNRKGDITELVEELGELRQIREPVRRRYLVNDSTVEALGKILAENPRGVVVLRDELMGLLRYIEKEGQESARAFYLEGWSGDGYFETDRIGRGNLRISGVCVSVIGTIQPGPLGSYIYQARKNGSGDDGFIQRFQLAVWPEDPAEWVNVDRWPDTAARQKAFSVFERLDHINPVTTDGVEIDPCDNDSLPYLHFTPEAQARFNNWMTIRENALREGHEHPAMESHLTKYRSLIPSLALIIHLAEGAGGLVSLHALEKAILWGDYLESHARRIFAPATDLATGSAKALVKAIFSGEVGERFRARDVYRNHWSGLSTKEDVQEAVGLLLELGWLREEREQTAGHPNKWLLVNPKVSTMEQKKRRAHSARTDSRYDRPPSGTFGTEDNPSRARSSGPAAAKLDKSKEIRR